jgi:CheY-like chemotaxis protein
VTGTSSSGTRRIGSILLVDDYPDARAEVREALEELGHVVVEAENGQQALNYLVSRLDARVSLIVLDLQMPVMDGWRFLDLLRCYVKLAHIPVIIVTATPQPRLDEVVHRAVLGCLQAPYEMRQLVEMVEAAMDPTSKAQRANEPWRYWR